MKSINCFQPINILSRLPFQLIVSGPFYEVLQLAVPTVQPGVRDLVDKSLLFPIDLHGRQRVQTLPGIRIIGSWVQKRYVEHGMDPHTLGVFQAIHVRRDDFRYPERAVTLIVELVGGPTGLPVPTIQPDSVVDLVVGCQ
jgi:hypothetical protein